MKKLLLIFVSSLCLVQIARGFDFHEKELESEESLLKLYERWGNHHSVSRSLDEREKRFNVFRHNVMHVHNTNKKNKSYTLNLNKFADLTLHEFKNAYTGSYVKHRRMLQGLGLCGSANFMYENVTDVRPGVDWRNVITSVKNQGVCGDCSWAFSALAAVEGILVMKTREPVDLSEQELLDCSTGQILGCNEGLVEDAFDYIKSNGITTETNYRYEAAAAGCRRPEDNGERVTIDGYERVPENDEEALAKAVTNQPVSVGIDTGSLDFQLYSEGIFKGDCGTKPNHRVTVVGYVDTPSRKYWTIKNSWGATWGEGGYMRIEKGISDSKGRCGIAMEPSYPVKL